MSSHLFIIIYLFTFICSWQFLTWTCLCAGGHSVKKMPPPPAPLRSARSLRALHYITCVTLRHVTCVILCASCYVRYVTRYFYKLTLRHGVMLLVTLRVIKLRFFIDIHLFVPHLLINFYLFMAIP